MRFRTLHRLAGLTGLLLFILLALTGIALNHSDALGLPDSHIQSPWLLRWYGREVQPVRQGYAVGQQWLSSVGDRLYINQSALDADSEQLLGAVASGPLRVAATDTGLWLFTAEGELVEHLSSGVAIRVRAIGHAADASVVIDTPDGPQQADADLLNWSRYPGDRDAIVWSQPRELPPTLAAQLARQHYGDGPSWERLLLDLHSGRLFGIPGWLPNWLLADLAALLILWLSFSGLWMWLRHHRLLAHHRRLHLANTHPDSKIQHR